MNDIKIAVEKFKHYFDDVKPINLNRVMVAVPTIKHRDNISIDKFNLFPNRFIFIEQTELGLYKQEISDGWTPVVRTAFGLPETRNQILQQFRNSKFDYLIMPDDELQYRKVVVSNDTFKTVAVETRDELLELFMLELARMERDNIDVLTITNTRFLKEKVVNTLRDKSGFDYSFVIYTKRALSNNYWYETASKTCEDLFMAKLLLADPTLKCRHSLILKRIAQKPMAGSTSTTGSLSDLDRTNEFLEQLSAKGFTADIMNLLWTPEHCPIKHYPLKYKRKKTYAFQEPNWSKFAY